MEFRERFVREAQTAGILSHPNIVTIHDIGEDADTQTSFIAMEYIEGQNLKIAPRREDEVRLRDDLRNHRRDRRGARLRAPQGDHPPRRQAGEHHHHDRRQGEDHRLRDRENRVLESHDDRPVPRHAQLHVARAGLRSPGGRAQRPLLARRRSLRAPDHQKPFQGDNLTAISYKIVHEDFTPPADVATDVPVDFNEIVARAMAKDPWNRYQRGKDLALALYQLKAQLEERRSDDDLGTMVSAAAESIDTLKLGNLKAIAQSGAPDPQETPAAIPAVGDGSGSSSAAREGSGSFSKSASGSFSKSGSGSLSKSGHGPPRARRSRRSAGRSSLSAQSPPPAVVPPRRWPAAAGAATSRPEEARSDDAGPRIPRRGQAAHRHLREHRRSRGGRPRRLLRDPVVLVRATFLRARGGGHGDRGSQRRGGRPGEVPGRGQASLRRGPVRREPGDSPNGSEPGPDNAQARQLAEQAENAIEGRTEQASREAQIASSLETGRQAFAAKKWEDAKARAAEVLLARRRERRRDEAAGRLRRPDREAPRRRRSRRAREDPRDGEDAARGARRRRRRVPSRSSSGPRGRLKATLRLLFDSPIPRATSWSPSTTRSFCAAPTTSRRRPGSSARAEGTGTCPRTSRSRPARSP